MHSHARVRLLRAGALSLHSRTDHHPLYAHSGHESPWAAAQRPHGGINRTRDRLVSSPFRQDYSSLGGIHDVFFRSYILICSLSQVRVCFSLLLTADTYVAPEQNVKSTNKSFFSLIYLQSATASNGAGDGTSHVNTICDERQTSREDSSEVANLPVQHVAAPPSGNPLESSIAPHNTTITPTTLCTWVR